MLKTNIGGHYTIDNLKIKSYLQYDLELLIDDIKEEFENESKPYYIENFKWGETVKLEEDDFDVHFYFNVYAEQFIEEDSSIHLELEKLFNCGLTIHDPY